MTKDTVTTKENTIPCRPTNPPSVILLHIATTTIAATHNKTATKSANTSAEDTVAKVEKEEREDTTEASTITIHHTVMIGLVMMVSMVMIFTELDTTVDTEDSVEREAKEVKVERVEVSDTNNVKQFANLLNTSQCHTTDRWSILCRSFLIR